MDHLLTDTISYKDVSGVSNAGDPTYGSVNTAAARWEETKKMVRSTDGSFRESNHSFITKTDLSSEAVVWAPGDATTSLDNSHRILEKKKASSPNADLTLYEYRV